VVGPAYDSRIFERREVLGDRQRSFGIALTLFPHPRAKQLNARYGQVFRSSGESGSARTRLISLGWLEFVGVGG
jgi:hypothetical protein